MPVLAALVASSLALGAGGALPVSDASGQVVQRQPPSGSCHAIGAGLFVLPDPSCTPGAVDPAVTEASIGRTICRAGWTSSVRPPEAVTEAEKRASIAAYGDYAGRRLGAYEYDHLVPLELGGAVNDPRNLWPERGESPNPKDRLEDALNALVCARRMGLAEAQQAIAGDWVAAYRRYVG